MKHKDWSGVWGIFGLEGAPVLGFLHRTIPFVVSLSNHTPA
jgi:hypothetical protein